MIERNRSAAGLGVPTARAESPPRLIAGARDARILAGPDVPPRHVTRDVRSALLAHLGTLVEHRAADVGLEQNAPDRATHESLELERRSRNRVQCRVMRNAAARTVSNAVRSADRNSPIKIEGVPEVHLAGRLYVIGAVRPSCAGNSNSSRVPPSIIHRKTPLPPRRSKPLEDGSQAT